MSVISRNYLLFATGFFLFVACMALGEWLGASLQWLGYGFLLATIFMYAIIGVFCRTADVTEYYVAGRRVPAVYNGMATAADWMSAASFLGMAGTLYVTGFGGLAFVMGWTGGYVLVSLLLAPYLRRFGQYTIPDFLGTRYEGRLPRVLGVIAVMLASFVYVVAQIYGVGLITSRFAGIDFSIGVFVGLAGVLVCSFLGGMRAITWTQVAQYLVIIVAYLTPVVMMSWQTTGIPVPQIAYGQVLERLGAEEARLAASPAEQQARAALVKRAESLEQRVAALPVSLLEERVGLIGRLETLQDANAPARDIAEVQRQLRALPADAASAREKWESDARDALARSQPPTPHAQAFPETARQSSEEARNNFIALVFVLMIGTAGLPHVLARYYTVTGVAAARNSVFWSLLFILLLYLVAPAYAVLAKWEIYHHVVGTPIADLPSWISSWGKLGMVKVEDMNLDGILQLAELSINPDVIVLATPEIAGLPYFVSGLIAAGGLAAALSTADGLLLTMCSALSHDVYFHVINPAAATQRRLLVSKATLMVVATLAAWVASLRPDSILFTVGFAFSIAASAIFPAMVAGVFWRRANKWGAVAAMLVGPGVAAAYALATHPAFGGSMRNAWFGIQPVSCGVFGVVAGFAALVLTSLVTAPPGQIARGLVEDLRKPEGA
ncbi:VC_2705 family sodium/solute symporter [Uliginosibacterium sp. H3]|uniref:VC_2705 family sodium/solute symporter n=1 Tax=Uliginosibacterium silvisoli TaxID=3114758 RepID=A0ABU6K3P7_9RHOO|nr:VC_2705 family sodium/solute symporter [Uliginosibacterium sp. H3]